MLDPPIKKAPCYLKHRRELTRVQNPQTEDKESIPGQEEIVISGGYDDYEIIKGV